MTIYDDMRNLLNQAETATSDLQTKVADLAQQNTTLQSQFDAYKAAHPDSSAKQMVLGTSGVPDNNVPWEQEYVSQVADYHARAGYFYGSASPTYSQIDSVPVDHDVMFQHQGTTRSMFDATLTTFPATRTGRLYLHITNEIDRQVLNGGIAMTIAQQRMDALYAAIAASGRPYLVPSVGLQYQVLKAHNAGDTSPRGDLPGYLRPGVKHIIWSSYAGPTYGTGHAVAKDPAARAKDIKTFMDSRPDLTCSIVTGFPIDDAHITDQTSLQNRVTFLKAAVAAYSPFAKHLLWFDKYWRASGDERLSEPTLKAQWLTLAKAAGQ